MRIKGHPVWIAFSLFSLFATLVLATGFGWAVKDVLRPSSDRIPAGEVQEAAGRGKSKEALLVSLGDSLTRGTGDTSGQGYVSRVKEALREKNGTLGAVNLAVKGQTSDQLKRQVKKKRVRALLGDARWITLTIGGNDLFRNSGALEELDPEGAEKARKAYRQNLNEILSVIRQENPSSPVFMFGLYNPFGDLGEKEISNRLVREWNRTLSEVAGDYEKVVVVPVYDIFQLNPEKVLYSDRFHPNRQGYEFMAVRLLQALHRQAEEVSADDR
ncbi:lysophospholipase L1-like esterase [Melghirimyces profundicolus]|uniref:Lysophospholipase L1-like esterase n=1 Tax=Melghirimyces profundicolus TaxID=1242148 RepID=A0A2T6BGZ9_9BACL|nr:GDSL-type esterase/lipase family protein [Melghirimyces profundicolus]PTX55316.1 lysophospholipase L1-like esterase [Melghirimyces profundicolus]